MEHLKSFNNITEFETYYTNIERKYPNISFIKNDNECLWMNNNTPFPIKCVFYNKKNNSFVKIYAANVEYNSNYVPSGVEIIPPYHDIYGNGKAGIISLKNMDIDKPFEGTTSTSVKMCWGPNKDIPGLLNGSRVNVIGETGLTMQNFGYLIKNGVYNYPSGHIPNPYKSNRLRNPDYYTTSVTANNALSDLNGKTNTQIIVTARGEKDYNTWKPGNAVNDYPAASVCDMYHTIGTKSGDWYLPSAGELGYLMAFWNEVQDCFNTIKNVYGEEYAVNPLDGDALWTSTENQAKNARYVETNNGLGYTDKNANYRIRAFIQI